ncbi:MAG: Gfo/Idh/MocA family oxidoreductase [Promethearchaeota archaeon]|nr:MAG: Gfo/Idh/MocA family oxidoreductase [Candidatus Lokiarchaeota archaeon]
MLRVGIIGCGAIFDLNVLGYLYSRDTELVAVSDIDMKCARNKLKKWNLESLPIYTDYKRMIDREDLDIVEILTPHDLHYPMAKYCAKAKVPGISVQKPLANTISNCNHIIKVCKEEKVKLKLFENFRFYPVYLRAKELLDEGIIGEPLNFRINNILMGGPSWSEAENMRVWLWRVNFDRCGGGPEIFDDGQHKFSLALWLMDQERVESVYSWIDYFTGMVDCPVNIIWRYPKKNPDDPPKFGTMEFVWASNVYYPSNYYGIDEFIEISGTKGMMWINQCTSGGNFLSKTPQFPPIIVYTGGEVKKFGMELPRDWRYSFINSTEQFIEVMKEGVGDPIYTGEQGKNLCIFAKMPYISDQRKKKVLWEEITAKDEEAGSCVVEPPTDVEMKMMTKYNMRKKRDMKKGIKQGLEHKWLNYDDCIEE